MKQLFTFSFFCSTTFLDFRVIINLSYAEPDNLTSLLAGQKFGLKINYAGEVLATEMYT